MNDEAQDSRLAELSELPARRRLRAEVKAVEKLVDAPYYRWQNHAVMAAGESPAEHFCRAGWRSLLKPRPDFDVWWYWANHLDPASDDINPLVHYALVGQAKGLSTQPRTFDLRSRAEPVEGRDVRRACLFAAFDQDGVVDETTLLYLTELGRHSDVFVLYDGYMPAHELAKLDGIATGSWAIRHGAYDFGSYAMLARDLVGWDQLATYDEVLFVNDSCFLLKSLDDVFSRMDTRACDWWGLQATKGMASTRSYPTNAFTSPIPLDQVKHQLADYEQDPVYDFLLGSYFLAFRRPVIEDPAFRRLIDSVHAQPSKLLVIQKYEIGLTHLLAGRGHDFDAYIPDLHPFHPIFTETYFTLLTQGFPLLKKYFLYQNHYDTPGLAHWKERVLVAAPDAPVDLLEQSLERTSPDDRLRRSYAITRDKNGRVVVPKVLSGKAYRRRNDKTPKRPDLWAFAVDPDTHELPASSRALIHAVKDDPDITKVVLTRSTAVHLTGDNLISVPILSPEGREHLLHAGKVFVNKAPRITLTAPVSTDDQVIVAVRDGLFFEKAGRAGARPTVPDTSARGSGARTLVHPEPPTLISGLLVASDVDALAAVACTWPARYSDTWRTGIPAHDFLFMNDEALPPDLLSQTARLNDELAGRRLLLFLPSLRRTGSAHEPYRFGNSERSWLQSWARRHDTVIGIREHDRDLERPYSAQFGTDVLDLSARRYPSLHAVMRRADAVLTEYASPALDFATTGRPVISFAHDLDTARARLLYDPEHFFPGPVCRTFDALTSVLDGSLETAGDAHVRQVLDLLVDRKDDANSARAVSKIRSTGTAMP